MNLTQHKAYDEDPMAFSEKENDSYLLDILRQQREARKFCDVVLYVDKTKFLLHKNVLAAHSPLFDSKFCHKKTVKERFNITSQNSIVFKQFVDYIYTGTAVINSHNVFDLLKLAHCLQVTRLISYCSEYLERNIEPRNCLKVKELSLRYGMPELSEKASQVIKINLCAILNSKEILEVDEDGLEALLLDGELELTPVRIIRTILDWVRFDVRNREGSLKKLLPFVKWNDVDPQFINEMMENENLFATSELSLYCVLNSLSQCGIAFVKYGNIFEALNQLYGPMCVEDSKCETQERIHKVSLERKTKKRLLRGNPIARLAALRSALLLRRRRTTQQRAKSNKEIVSEEMRLDAIEAQEYEPSRPLKCHLCAHYASDTTALEHHLSSVHSRDVTYKCGVCGYVCQWNNLYLEHVRGHFPGPPYKCDSCDYTCDKLNSVLTHRSMHLEEKSYRCLQCGFRTRSQSALLSHTKCHVPHATNNEKNNQSGDIRNYVCDFCGFTSKFLSHLIAHKRIHTGDVYRCSYPHCKFTTAKKTQLGSHAKSHQGSRPHCCQICGRGFLEKSHLVRHERIHLEEKPFKCHECDYASSRRDKLKEHQARHHGDHASAKVPYKARPNKKSSQVYRDSYSPTDSTVRGHHGSHSSSASDVPEGLVPQHAIPGPGVNPYPAFPTNDHGHHTAASSSTLDFHSQQLLTTTNRGKDHRTVQHTSAAAAAVTAAMMLDPRFHHGNAGGGAYVAPVGAITQTAGQVNQHGHQVADYPTPLMSLF